MPPTLLTIICMLLTASMMWPSEGAVEGSGLHLAALWIATAIFVVWRRDSFSSCSLSRYGSLVPAVGWIVLVVGFWCSTCAVFHANGDRRAALNLCFEWTAIGVVWWVTARCAFSAFNRNRLLLLLIGLSVGTALQGILQHHVSYEHQADWYRSGRAVLDAAAESNDLQLLMKARDVMAEFQALDVPVAGAARELFERRLLASSEPVGPFALANTLAGFLAVSLVLLAGVSISELRSQSRGSWRPLFRVALPMLVVGYCLVLTKSRTSWIACSVGIACLLLGRGISAKLRSRLAIGLLTLIPGMVSIGMVTGALDREVVLESPRSLQFRLLYWMGTAGVIADSPVFGSGPGNFRQAYLIHKPVESSEEIQDPHNIVLDAWCSAGLLGLVGVVLIGCKIASAAISSARESQATEIADTSDTADASDGNGECLGIIAGAVLHVFWLWFQGNDLFDLSAADWSTSRNVVLLVPVGALLTRFLPGKTLQVPAHVIGAAGLTLLVHLLGAGGLQITTIGLVIAVLSGCLVAAAGIEDSENSGLIPFGCPETVGRGVISAGLALVTVAIIVWGIFPIQNADRNLQFAKSQDSQGNFKSADKALLAATVSDPLSVSLRQRRAEQLAYQFSRNQQSRALSVADGTGRFPHLNEVLAATDDLIAADRKNWTAYAIRGNVRLAAVTMGVDETQRDAGIADLELASQLYPTNAELWVTLAKAYDAAKMGDKRQLAVSRALTIDESNRAWGHVDRFLGDDALVWLAEKSEGPAPFQRKSNAEQPLEKGAQE